MRLVKNTGTDCAVDVLLPSLNAGGRLDAVTAAFSVFGFAALASDERGSPAGRMVLRKPPEDLGLFGGPADRHHRNRLQARWLVGRLAKWLRTKAEVRFVSGAIPQGMLVARDSTHPLAREAQRDHAEHGPDDLRLLSQGVHDNVLSLADHGRGGQYHKLGGRDESLHGQGSQHCPRCRCTTDGTFARVRHAGIGC